MSAFVMSDEYPKLCKTIENFGYDIKYIPGVMIPTVQLAIKRLKKISENEDIMI